MQAQSNGANRDRHKPNSETVEPSPSPAKVVNWILPHRWMSDRYSSSCSLGFVPLRSCQGAEESRGPEHPFLLESRHNPTVCRSRWPPSVTPSLLSSSTAACTLPVPPPHIKQGGCCSLPMWFLPSAPTSAPLTSSITVLGTTRISPPPGTLWPRLLFASYSSQ